MDPKKRTPFILPRGGSMTKIKAHEITHRVKTIFMKLV